jgi:hypothetical protein
MSDTSLEQRIVAAFSDDAITSVALSELVVETEAAITAADEAAEAERAKALDPALSPDRKAARAAMEDAEFARDRLRTLLPRLQQHHARVARAEVKAAWVQDYDRVSAQCDALAEELKSVYCEFAPKLVDILTRSRQLNAEIRRVRSAKPGISKIQTETLTQAQKEAPPKRG